MPTQDHPHPLSQQTPYAGGATTQYAYMGTCMHSAQDHYITRKDSILGCHDCEGDIKLQQERLARGETDGW